MCKVYIEAKVICQSQLGRGHGDSAAHSHPHTALGLTPRVDMKTAAGCKVSLTVSGYT